MSKSMNPRKGKKRQIHISIEDDFDVLHVELIEFSASPYEKDEEFVWVEDQTSRHTLFRAKTMVLISLATLGVSFIALLH